MNRASGEAAARATDRLLSNDGPIAQSAEDLRDAFESAVRRGRIPPGATPIVDILGEVIGYHPAVSR